MVEKVELDEFVIVGVGTTSSSAVEEPRHGSGGFASGVAHERVEKAIGRLTAEMSVEGQDCHLERRKM
jgi:hypothetical protein